MASGKSCHHKIFSSKDSHSAQGLQNFPFVHIDCFVLVETLGFHTPGSFLQDKIEVRISRDGFLFSRDRSAHSAPQNAKTSSAPLSKGCDFILRSYLHFRKRLNISKSSWSRLYCGAMKHEPKYPGFVIHSLNTFAYKSTSPSMTKTGEMLSPNPFMLLSEVTILFYLQPFLELEASG